MHSAQKPIQFAGETIAMQRKTKPKKKKVNRKGKKKCKKWNVEGMREANSTVNKLQRAKGKNNTAHLSQWIHFFFACPTDDAAPQLLQLQLFLQPLHQIHSALWYCFLYPVQCTWLMWDMNDDCNLFVTNVATSNGIRGYLRLNQWSLCLPMAP